MCTVSAIYESAKQVPLQEWTWPAWEGFQEIVEKARKFDEMMGLPDCEDPAKEAVLRQILERLEALEAKEQANANR